MKHCSQCLEVYDDSLKFCEKDGMPLLQLTDQHMTTVQTQDQHSPNRAIWITGLIGLMTGIVLCLLAYVVYSLFQIQTDSRPTDAPTYTSQRQQPAPRSREDQPLPRETEEPNDETSETDSVTEASPEPSPVQTQEAKARLNQGPISTGQGNGNNGGTQTVIELNDGSNMLVDAAWQDAQGVWYRRGGLVSYIDSHRVKAITARAEPKNVPTDNQ